MSEQPNGFVTASHAILFEEHESERCDVCKEALAKIEGDDDDGYGVQGRGVYVWARGEERRYTETPLCAGCAAAIGVSALQRWEIEEEEG